MNTLIHRAVIGVAVLAAVAFLAANIYTAITCDGQLVRPVLFPAAWSCK